MLHGHLEHIEGCLYQPQSEAKTKEAQAYHKVLSSKTTIFLIHFLHDVLSTIELATKMLQDPKEDVASSLELLSDVRTLLKAKKNFYTVGKISSIIGTDSTNSSSMAIIHDDQPPTKRKRCIPKHLSDSVITAPLPQFHACEDSKNLKSLANEILDCLEEELQSDFLRKYMYLDFPQSITAFQRGTFP